jgi:hypothetical protein
MYHTTGFTRDEISELCAAVRGVYCAGADREWPPILGLRESIVVTLTYARRNRVQVELGESYGVSQPTVSRAIAAITPLLERALMCYVPTAEDLDADSQYIVDGTLLPCWSWHNHRELYSGKHRTTGRNVQVACTLSGRLAWISDPVDGCRHDTTALSLSGVLSTLDPSKWIGDKGYLGNNMITPIRKPIGRPLLKWETEFNTAINKIRYMIERTIANLKTWRILYTDYRRPLATFNQTISAVIALEFYRTVSE